MATVEEAGSPAPAWRGGFGWLWTAAVVSRFGDALRGAALPLLAAAFFVLSVLALIPAREPDVPVVAPHGDATTAHATR